MMQSQNQSLGPRVPWYQETKLNKCWLFIPAEFLKRKGKTLRSARGAARVASPTYLDFIKYFSLTLLYSKDSLAVYV